MAFIPTVEDFDRAEAMNKAPKKKFVPTVADFDAAVQASDKESSYKQPSYEEFMAERGYPTTSQTENTSRGFAAGIMDLARGAANVIPHLQQWGGFKKSYEPFTAEQFGETKLLPKEIADTDEAKAGFLTGQVVGSSAVPMGEGDVGARMIKSFLTGEALSPVYSPDEPINETLKKSLPYSAGGALIEPAIKGLKSLMQGMMTMGGTASSAEFAKNVKAASGKPVGIAELSVSPWMAKAEQNILGNVVGSGVMHKNIAVGKGLDQDVNSILAKKNVLPEKEDVTQLQRISQNFQKNIKMNETKKTNLYDTRNKVAQETEGSFLADERKSDADSLLSEIDKEKERKGHTNVSSSVIKELKAASRNKPVPFSELNFDKKVYNDLAEEYSRSGKLNDARIMKRLSSSYQKDIDNALNEPGKENLKEAQEKADKFFAEKIQPIRGNPSLYNHAFGYKDASSFINDVISKGDFENPGALKLVMDNLDEPFKKQFTHEYLTKGAKTVMDDKEIKSDRVLTLYSKLGDQTKDLMFTPEEKSTMDKGLVTRRLMGTNIDAMVNPKTGYANTITGGILATGALGTAITTGLTFLGLSPGEAAVAASALTPGAARTLGNYLTSSASKKVYKAGAKLRESKSPRTPVNPALLLQAHGDKNE